MAGIGYSLPGVTVTVEAETERASGGTNDWHGRASIVRRSDGALILFWRRATAHAQNDGPGISIKFSDDEGATWTSENTKLGGGSVANFPMNPPVSANQDASEPWAIVAPNGDILLFMWRVDYGASIGGTYMSRSTDDGETWSSPATLVDFTGVTDDTEVFMTDDGFVFDDVIYAGARIYEDASGDPSQSVLMKSDDDGVSWELVSIICDSDEGGTGGQEVGLEYLGDQTILAMIRDNPHEKSYQRWSTDMGETWGTLLDVTSTVGIAARQRVYTRAHLMGLEEWWTDPVIIMCGFVHQDFSESHPRRSAVWVSIDRGHTWDGPNYVDTETEDAGYGDLAYNRDTGEFFFMCYQGTLAAAALNQYDFSIAVS